MGGSQPASFGAGLTFGCRAQGYLKSCVKGSSAGVSILRDPYLTSLAFDDNAML
jgi:hypothetical protein